jgi:GAF domain-containing protein
MATSELQSARLFARVARELTYQDGVSGTTRRIVELAEQLVGCTCSVIWSIAKNGQIVVAAATDDRVAGALAEILRSQTEGAGHEPLTTGRTVHMADIETETRWPSYVLALQERQLPVRSALVFPLAVPSGILGALAVYSDQSKYFTDELTEIAGVLAEHATLALDAAGSMQHADNLARALDSNRRIGMAIGVVMALHRIEEGQAFDVLRVASQTGHVKLRELAEDVILTGALPSRPRGRQQPGRNAS